MRALMVAAVIYYAAAGELPAVQSRAPQRAPGSRVTTDHDCAAALGQGVKSRRAFCDVIVAAQPRESVSITSPPRTGPATLLFDLHNRFGVPVVSGFPGASYVRHEAVVRVVGSDGAVIGRAAVVREFRTITDLFDQIGGGARPGGIKGVAPGPPEAARIVVPEGVSVVGIVGERVRVRSGSVGDEDYDAPGRPVAIVSNIRLEYRPR